MIAEAEMILVVPSCPMSHSGQNRRSGGAVCLVIAIRGGGIYSVDRLIGKEL
jgi:hypothetical protein